MRAALTAVINDTSVTYFSDTQRCKCTLYFAPRSNVRGSRIREMARNNAIADVFPARADGTAAFGTKGRIFSGKKRDLAE